MRRTENESAHISSASIEHDIHVKPYNIGKNVAFFLVAFDISNRCQSAEQVESMITSRIHAVIFVCNIGGQRRMFA